MSAWKPSRDEAEFLGSVWAIDAGLAGICKDLLSKGHPLYSVRATLDDALKIARMIRTPEGRANVESCCPTFEGSPDCSVCGGDCSAANPPVMNCPLDIAKARKS